MVVIASLFNKWNNNRNKFCIIFISNYCFSSSKEEVGQVSGFVQSVGYLLASSGPVIFGVLKDTFNNWNTTLLCLLLVAAFTAIIGLVMIRMGRQHFLRLNK